MANIQHNCADCQCSIQNIRKVRQERIEIDSLAPGIEHYNVKNVVLNTSKMHDSQIIQSFHKEPNPIDRGIAIHTGAAREIAIQREKQRLKDSISTDIQQSVIDPTQTGRGLRGGQASSNLSASVISDN